MSEAIGILGWHEGYAGQVHSWIEECTDYRVQCFLHWEDAPPVIDLKKEQEARDASKFDFPEAGLFKNIPFICKADWTGHLIATGINSILILTHDSQLRHRHIQQARQAGLKIVSAIHPGACILEEALLGDGIIAFCGAVVGYRAEIGDGVILNTGAQVDHHSVIKSCATLDPSVTTAGCVTIGECAHVHIGATIINRIRIGERSIIGAGAVVITDIPDDSTAVGVPARVLPR